MSGAIDITNQEKVAYDFARQATTAEDIRLAKRLLGKVYTHITEFKTGPRPGSVSFYNRSKRSCRIIVHNIDALLQKKNLAMVGFYGHDRGTLTPELNKEYAETDWKILTSMIDSNDMLCYASQQLSSGNWFNIVLFTEESKKQVVKAKDAHKYAAYVLAPKRFQWVRIQNAILPDGMANYGAITFIRTRYYEFDDYWFATREY
jgi:hypothetical protein